MKKKHLLLLAMLVACFVPEALRAQQSFAPEIVRPILDAQQARALTYFTTFSDPGSGLAHEGNGRGDGLFITTGGSGFGLMALLSGVERGWITRDSAARQIQKSVRFLGKAKRVKGVWPHWLNTDGTARSFGSEQVLAGDLVETSFLMAGLMASREFFDGSATIEKEIRDSVTSFWNTINWKFYTNNKNVLYWAYDEGRPTAGDARWVLPTQGWNEGLLAYVMALAAPSANAISTDVYTQGWLRNGDMFHPSNTQYGYNYVLAGDKGGPLFLSQYSFLGLDPRVMKDDNCFYWREQVLQTLINRQYCLSGAPSANGYNEQNWGLSACYGVDGAPGTAASYLAREPHNDDGVIAPTAAVSSMPYAPYYSLQVFLNLAAKPSNQQGLYGFADSYMPSTNTYTTRNLAIDQGPIVVMIENYRSGLIWNLLMKSPEIQSGLAKAGITKPSHTTGFPLVVVNTQTGVYDMVRHPDRGVYELPYSVQTAEQVLFSLKNEQGQVLRKFYAAAKQGSNICRFTEDCNTLVGNKYTVEMATSSGSYTLPVHLR